MDFEPIEYTGRVVDAPIELKVGRITKYLMEDIFPDAIRAVEGGSEIAGLLLGFATLEYIVGYFVGKQSTRHDVLAFLSAYYPVQYAPFADAIYDHLRSGLVHNLTLQNPWMPVGDPFRIEKDSQMHLTAHEGAIVFSIRHFLEDTRRGYFMYCHALIMKPAENASYIRNFHRRFNRKDGAASMMEHTD
jgi:hypothetical protein